MLEGGGLVDVVDGVGSELEDDSFVTVETSKAVKDDEGTAFESVPLSVARRQSITPLLRRLAGGCTMATKQNERNQKRLRKAI